MAATIETLDGREVMYITDPFTRRLLEQILEVLRAKAARKGDPAWTPPAP